MFSPYSPLYILTLSPDPPTRIGPVTFQTGPLSTFMGPVLITSEFHGVVYRSTGQELQVLGILIVTALLKTASHPATTN